MTGTLKFLPRTETKPAERLETNPATLRIENGYVPLRSPVKTIAGVEELAVDSPSVTVHDSPAGRPASRKVTPWELATYPQPYHSCTFEPPYIGLVLIDEGSIR